MQMLISHKNPNKSSNVSASWGNPDQETKSTRRLDLYFIEIGCNNRILQMWLCFFSPPFSTPVSQGWLSLSAFLILSLFTGLKKCSSHWLSTWCQFMGDLEKRNTNSYWIFFFLISHIESNPPPCPKHCTLAGFSRPLSSLCNSTFFNLAPSRCAANISEG